MKRVLVLSAQLLLAFAPAAAQNATVDPAATEKCDGPVYRQSEVSRRPVIVSKPDPGFTEEARANNVSGTVAAHLFFVVKVAGPRPDVADEFFVRQMSVALDHQLFDQAARARAARARVGVGVEVVLEPGVRGDPKTVLLGGLELHAACGGDGHLRQPEG